MSTETSDDEFSDGPPADDSETWDPPGQGLGFGMPSLSSPMGSGLAMLATGGAAAGPLAYQGLAGLMQPSPGMQQRAGQAQALPPGYAPPVAPMQPQQLGPPMPPGGLPQKPVTPGSRVGVPGAAMPQMDWAKAQQAQDAAAKEQREGVAGAGDIEAKQAEALAASQAAAAKQQVDYANNMQQAQDAAYKQVTTEQTAIQKNMEELSKAKVDPSHWWNSRSTAQKASAAFGIALSQMGSAFTHAPALDLVSKYVDQDIDAQKTNIENQRQTLNDRSNMLQKNYQVFQNWADAQKATKLQLMDGLLKQGQAQAEAMQPGLIKQQTIQKIGAMDQQNQAAKTDLWEKRHTNLVQDKGLQFQAENLSLESKRLELEAGEAGQASGQRSVQVGGAAIPFSSDKDKEDFERQLQALKSVKEGVQKNSKTLEEMGFSDRARHFLNTATGGLVSDSSKYGALNAAQEAVAVNSNAALGSTQAQTEQQYKNMREGLNTPSSPGVGKAAGQSIITDAYGSAKAKLMASVPGMTPQIADRLLLQELGYGKESDVGEDPKAAALARARGG